MRHTALTTEQAIEILAEDGSIYWTDEGYDNAHTIDWKAIAAFFGTEEIHTFCNGYVTRIYLSEEERLNFQNKLAKKGEVSL